MVTHEKPGQTKTPTMRDIAASAGVSLSTVSLVINEKPGVSPDRREHVLKVIKELGYIADGHLHAATDS